MTSVEQLIVEHDNLDALATQLEEQVRQVAPNLVTVLALRARLSVELNNHLTGEDAALYPGLATSNDEKLIGAVDSFQSELASLKIDWMAYLEEWCDDAIDSDWTSFAQETLTMMARLRTRIARENACLIPAALQRSVVRLRAAA